MRTVNVVPISAVEVTSTAPPLATTISRTMFKPSPMLPGFRPLRIPALRNASANRRSWAIGPAESARLRYARSTPRRILPGRILLKPFSFEVTVRSTGLVGDPC